MQAGGAGNLSASRFAQAQRVAQPRIDVMLGGRASEERTCPVAVGLRPRSRNLLARHFELVLRAKPILAIEAVHAAALEVELIGALGDVGGRQDDERG